LNREGAKSAKGFLYESGTPAEKALAGDTIRTKFSCPAGNGGCENLIRFGLSLRSWRLEQRGQLGKRLN
jgi:hypothetical protein